ncbi:MAG: hypothetical protein AAFP67_04420 [Pseudomonadota bacterium]
MIAPRADAVVLDDFDGGSLGSIAGVITDVSGDLQTEVTTIGTGLCDGYSGGSGGALCLQGDSTGPADEIFVDYEGITFNDTDELTFTLATLTSADFEAADFINVSVGFDTDTTPGNDQFVQIVNFIGDAAGSSGTPGQQFVQTGGIATASPTSSTFQMIVVPVQTILLDAGVGSGTTGDLRFNFSLSSVNEFAAFDNVSLVPVPLGPTLPLLLAGIGALALHRRMMKS